MCSNRIPRTSIVREGDWHSGDRGMQSGDCRNGVMGEGWVSGQGAGALPTRWLLHITIHHHVRSSGVHTRSRRLLVTTLTELKAMAALARIGLSMMPQRG